MERLVVLWTLLVPAEFAGLTPTPTPEPRSNLTCYYCFKAEDAALCTPKRCSLGEEVCVSSVVHYYLKTRLTVIANKRCAVRCTSGNSVFMWTPGPEVQAKVSRYCCSRNLCNAAPAPGTAVWALHRGLLLCVGLLWALL